MRHPVLLSILYGLLCAIPFQASAFHQPLWELGFGIGVLHAPLYRGSKTEKNYVIPFPFPIYRGETFRSDEKGIYGRIFDTERISLDISIAGNVPVPSGKVGAREGMPSLDPVGEIGPELEMRLWDSRDHEYSFWLKLPWRAVFSVGDPLVKYQGWGFSPYAQFQRRIGTDRDWWRMRVAAGPMYADARYHDYFYEVDSHYISPSRTEYHPNSGYSGSRITLTLSRHTRKYFYGVFVRYDNLNNATFVDSPLVETRDYLVGGFAFSWIFKTSKVMVEHYE